ncbi:MAG: DUF2341 domain-containing protein [Bacteroidales bacterium]|nr:DUF2341 domain-containing protein [Bacteroidales bacterium]
MIASVFQKHADIGKRWMIFLPFFSLSLVTWGQTQTFTSNGNYIVPAGVYSITVECWGAGGGGSTITSNGRRGGGGGGGAYAKSVVTVTPGISYAVIVGTGGSANTAGGNSSFNTNTVVAAGGGGGTNNSTVAGTGGSVAGSVGTTRYAGGNGANGDVTSNYSGGGGGGAGSDNPGGHASGSTAGTGSTLNGGDGGAGVKNSKNGNKGNTYGGGGSGASTNSGTDRIGGSGASGLVVITPCSAASMGYSYERNITIDHNKVSGGSDLYNFPVLINLTGQNFLKTAPTGQISNANGYDIIFTDSNYNQLDHQLEYYNGTNGDLVAWVRIPTLSYSSNTVIKILYENPQITTDPSVTSVWDSHYKGVWHLDNNSLKDFTSFDKAGTSYNSPSYPTGKIYNSLGLNGTDEYVQVTNDPNINFAGNLTVSAWVYMNAINRDQKIAGNQNNSSGGYKFGIFSNNKVEFEIRNSSNIESLNRNVTGGTVLTTGVWYYLAGISSDVLDSIKTFVNGIPERPFKKTGTLGTASNNLTIGKEPWSPEYYFNGIFDEIRISDEVRSNGWMMTEYNNQSSPSTFYTLDATATLSNNLPSSSICSGPITLTFGYPSGGSYSGNPYIAGNIFTPPSAGTYQVIYTYNGDCGLASVTKTFNITDTPPAPVAPNREYCVNQIAYLEATSGENISWYRDGTLVSTANPFSTGQTAAGTYNYTVTQKVNGCESPASNVTLTIYGGCTISTQPQPVSVCEGDNASFSVEATGHNLTYQWQENGTDVSDGGIYSGAATSTLTLTNPGLAKNGMSYRCVITTSCGTSTVNSTTAQLTVTARPVATFSYSGTPYCPNAANPSPEFSGGGVAGTFSSTSGLVFVSTATGQVNLAASTPGIYTVTNTIAAAGGCGIVTATSSITIISDMTWTGGISTDWNTPGNWSCGIIPNSTTSVQIPNTAVNKPFVSTGATGTVNDLVIDNGSSFTVEGSIQISGTITNNGLFDAENGTIELNGTALQSLGPGTFNGNKIKNLIINNSSGVSLLNTLKVKGVVLVTNGNLSSNGNLILTSTASGTALIDGSGSGTVTGNVTMERYLSSGFGYKYFSSPFQAATVGEFGDDMNLASPFTSFYRYDENRTVSGLPASGWVSYKTTTNLLNPLAGYAVNFGSNSAANTVDVTGVVNNGSVSATLYNHNQIYTKGFNLVGNPYPSPIDWDLVKSLNTNIDDAVYYFKASASDQYGGTYATYINHVSSDGVVNNMIPSMQGFFVRVSDGSYPVTGTMTLNNSVRITDLTHSFSKSGEKDAVKLIRLTATFTDDNNSSDPMVIYFDDKATDGMDQQLDALKLYNTDLKVPNLYAVSSAADKLSIDALPLPDGSLCQVPLGLKTNKAGNIVFKISDVDETIAANGISLFDNVTGTQQDMLNGNEYSLFLDKAEYLNRFFLNIGSVTTNLADVKTNNSMFNIFSVHGTLKVDIPELPSKNGTLYIYNLTGQTVFIQKIFEAGHHEFNVTFKDGIYIATFISGEIRNSRKLFIGN